MSRAHHHDNTGEDEENGASPARTRIKGVLFLAGGGIGIILSLVLSAYLAKQGLFPRRGGVPAMVLIFIPVVFTLIGFTELLTGFELRQVARKWDDLKTWQRGILGTLLAFSPFIFYSIGVALF